MPDDRRDGIYLLLLGIIIFLTLGFALSRSAAAPMLDFRALYYPSRCLLHHCDPYSESQVRSLYLREGTYGSIDTERDRQMVSRLVYLPPTLSFTVFFALFPWQIAQILWSIFTASSLVLAAFLIWSCGADHKPLAAGCLLGFLLANCELFLMQGMCAGIAISLCAISVWCFFRNRFVNAGICCLAVSLAIKPQDTGLVWLYLILAGGICRRHALRTLLTWLAISLPAFVSVWMLSSQWTQELRSNVLAFSVHGGLNDPGLASSGAHGLSRIISLQSVLSAIWDEPIFYNSISFALIVPMIVLWAYLTITRKASLERAWIAIAAAAPLVLLPIYHRQYDALLILFTVPACAILLAEGGPVGRLAFVVTTVGFIFSGELPWVGFLLLVRLLHIQAMGAFGNVLRLLLTGLEVFATPLTILSMGIFYLWIYARWVDCPDQ